MQALIDGDPIVYASCFGAMAEAKRQGVDTPLDWALAGVDERIKDCLKVCETLDFRLFIGGKGNYRYDLFPEYKAHRKDVDRPEHYEAVREDMIKIFGAEVVNGEEVDDRLGVLQGEDTIICTIDKDLDCIPGWHYNWGSKRYQDGVYYVSEVEANRFFYTQCLTGDATDGIPGLKKLTGKVATKKRKLPIQSMDLPFDMYSYVARLYGDIPFHHVASCLWIRREEGEVWSPPNEERQEDRQCDNGITEEVLVSNEEKASDVGEGEASNS